MANSNNLRIWCPFNGEMYNHGISGAIPVITGNVNLVNAGKLTNCITFASTGGHINFPASTMTSFTSCSVAFWIRINTWNSSYETYFQAGTGGTPWNNYIFGILRNNANSTVCFTIGDGTTTSTANYLTSEWTTGQWFHMAFTYESGKCRIYKNGVLDNEYNTSIVPAFNKITTITVGRCNDGSSYPTSCSMNDFRIYNCCLTQSEIQDIVNITEKSDLMLHYPLNRQGLGAINPNLVMNTYSMPVNSTTTRGFRVSGTGVVTHLDYDDLPVGDGVIRLTNNTSAAAWGGIAQDTLDGFIAGQKYSQSCWVRASTTITDFNLQPAWISSTQKTVISTNKTINTTWQYIKYEGITLEGEQSTYNPGGYSGGYAYCTLPVGGWMEICGMKVELGEEATPWTPHILDEFNKIVNYDYNSVYHESDGSRWIKIAHHNNPASYLFSSTNSFYSGVYLDSNRWYNIEQMCRHISKYEFIVGQKNTSDGTYYKYRWTQYKNPTIATWADVQPGAVIRNTSTGYTDGTFGGLYMLNSSTRMCIANANNGNWWGAFGAWTAYQGGIPGHPTGGVVTTGYMDLWIRIDNALEEFKEYDISGNDIDGNKVGHLNWSTNTPKYKASVELKGGSGILGDSYSWYGHDVGTLAAWVKPTERSYGDRSIVILWHGTTYLSISQTGLLSAYGYGKSPAGYHDSNATIPLNVWTHIAIVWEPSQVKLYINGNLDKTISSSGTFTGSGYSNIQIGREFINHNRDFTGNISDCRVYSKALTATEVLSLYNNEAYIDDNNIIYGQIRNID